MSSKRLSPKCEHVMSICLQCRIHKRLIDLHSPADVVKQITSIRYIGAALFTDTECHRTACGVGSTCPVLLCTTTWLFATAWPR